MSEEGDGLPVVRVKFACANVEEFRRKFEPNLLAKGMLARTPQMHEVGKRVMLRLELQDGSLGVDEEAVVQALEWTGGKQAMRLQLVRLRNGDAVAPVAAAAVSAAGPQAVALPAPRVATGTAIPAAGDWATKAPERSRSDTETTRAMSLDELLNALPPTAKPKLTPSGGMPRLATGGGMPHTNGTSSRTGGPLVGGGFHPVPPAPPPPAVMPLAPPISAAPSAAPAPEPVEDLPPLPAAPQASPFQAYAPPPSELAPAPSYAPWTDAPPVPDAELPAATEPLPPPVVDASPRESDLPPTIRPMTPMFPMPTPFPSTPPHQAQPPPPPPMAAEPEPEPEPAPEPGHGPAEVFTFPSAAEFRSSLTGEVTVGTGASYGNGEADSAHESGQPGGEPAVDPAGPTAFNSATEATTASNATIAVPGLAAEVAAAKRRGPGRAIATFILFLAALSGAAAYLWRTGQLEEYAPELAARLPPSPSSHAQPAAPPAAAEAPKAAPAAAAAEAPKPPAEAPNAEAASPPDKAAAPAEAPKPAAETPKTVAAAAEPPKAPADAPKPAAETPKTVAAAAEPPKAPAEAPKPPPEKEPAAAPETPKTAATATAETPAAADAPQVKLVISTDPPGAKVLANGEAVGVSPMELPWAAGKPIKLRFTKTGFKPASRSFTPKATGTLNVPLAPAAAQADELKDVY